MEEVGIATVYEPGNASSHFRPLRDSARIYAPLLRFTGAGLASSVIDWVGVMVLHLLTGSLLVGVVGTCRSTWIYFNPWMWHCGAPVSS